VGTGDATSARIFFALWPPAVVVDAIETRVDALSPGGRRVARERLHLTLAFHGCCSAARLAELKRSVAGVRIPAFELVLDRIGHFRRPGITWLAPEVTPAPLARLAAALAPPSAVTDKPFVFRPHVSITRKAAPRAPATTVPIVWPVRSFSLVASGCEGAPGRYRELAQWRLENDAVPGTRV